MALENVTVTLSLPDSWDSGRANAALDQEARAEMARRGLTTITDLKPLGGVADDRTPGNMVWSGTCGMG